MLKDHLAKYYFEGNYNCAESVLHAGNDYYDLQLGDREMILVAAYGGGMLSGHTCGAVLGAAALLSMKYCEAKCHECEDLKPITNLFLDKVKAAAGSLLCSDIKPLYFTEEGRCIKTCELICDILEETIAEYGKAPLR